MTDNDQKQHGMDRRSFLKSCGYAFGGLVVLNSLGLEGCSSPTGPNAGNSSPLTVDVSSLKTDGSSLVTNRVGPDGFDVIVIRKSAGVFTALSMTCTHAGCQVDPPSNNSIYCACHGSVFDLSGNVVRGPAGSPLTHYNNTYNASNNTITITF